VALWQQFASTQETHDVGEDVGAVDMVAALKISDAAGQLPPPSAGTTELSTAPLPASPGADPPPPDTGEVQATPSTGLQVPSCGGFDSLEDEQATSAARAATGPSCPARPWRQNLGSQQSQEPSPNCEERPVVLRRAITFSLLLTLAYSWAVAGVSVKRGTGVDAAEWRTGSHQFGPIRG
jgi:hypothetical protein